MQQNNFSTPLFAYECGVTCGNGSARSSLYLNVFGNLSFTKTQLVVGRN